MAFWAIFLNISFFLMSRHKGVVANVADGSGTVSVRLDDGRVKYLDLSKQGVRFVSQKQKRSKASMV